MNIEEFLEMCNTEDAVIYIYDTEDNEEVFKGTVEDALNELDEYWLGQEVMSWEFDFMTKEIGINC